MRSSRRHLGRDSRPENADALGQGERPRLGRADVEAARASRGRTDRRLRRRDRSDGRGRGLRAPRRADQADRRTRHAGSLLAAARAAVHPAGRRRCRGPAQPGKVLTMAVIAVDVVMPQMGVSVSEGTVTKWLKSVGDPVIADEPLLEISTDKVDTEVPSPGPGRARGDPRPGGRDGSRRDEDRDDPARGLGCRRQCRARLRARIRGRARRSPPLSDEDKAARRRLRLPERPTRQSPPTERTDTARSTPSSRPSLRALPPSTMSTSHASRAPGRAAA